MNDYIKREDAVRWEPDPKSEREYQTGNLDDAYESGYDNKVRQIENLPAADVRENVCGNWVHIGGDEWCCKACGRVITTEGSWEHPKDLGYYFCPGCGAQLEEVQR